jgi:hypothetical protein
MKSAAYIEFHAMQGAGEKVMLLPLKPPDRGVGHFSGVSETHQSMHNEPIITTHPIPPPSLIFSAMHKC